MGLEQSSLSNLPILSGSRKNKPIVHQDSLSSGNISPLSGEMPYYTYFSGKQIGSDPTNPSLLVKNQPISTSKSLNFSHMRTNKNLSNSQSNSLPEGITIVSEGRPKTVDTDPFMMQLYKIPLHYPILKSGLNIPQQKKISNQNLSSDISNQLSHVTKTICRHFTGLSHDLVMAQNTAVGPKMADLESDLTSLSRDLMSRSRGLDAILDAFTDPDLDFATSPSLLLKLGSDMQRLEQLCAHLNAQLPPEHSLPDL